jgi:hypothetical protein
VKVTDDSATDLVPETPASGGDGAAGLRCR